MLAFLALALALFAPFAVVLAFLLGPFNTAPTSMGTGPVFLVTTVSTAPLLDLLVSVKCVCVEAYVVRQCFWCSFALLYDRLPSSELGLRIRFSDPNFIAVFL